jgi:hypothetical protein
MKEHEAIKRIIEEKFQLLTLEQIAKVKSLFGLKKKKKRVDSK